MPDVTSSFFEDNVLKISGTGGASVANKATGTYGALTVTAAGLWTYTPVPSKIASLAFGQTYTENITLDSKTFAFTIYGTNDEAKVGGTKTATVLEDTGSGTVVVSGALTVTDPDSGESAFRGILSGGNIVNSVSKTYGTFTFNADTKIWKYTYDTSDLQTLGAKDAPSEQIVIVTKDGSTSTVTVNIKGANDVATITGTVTSTLTEDADVTDGSTGANIVSMNAGVVDIAATAPKKGFLHASGDLNISGNDGTDNKFTAGVFSKTYGIFAIDEDGNWTYDAANNSSAIQALTDGSTKVESIVVKSKDGLNSTTVSITIKGASNTTAGGSGVATESNTGKDSAISGTLTVLDNGAALSVANRPSDVTVADHGSTAATSGGASGAYGLFTYTASTNKWTYTLNSSLTAIDNLKANETLTDTLTISGKDVIVVIKGADDLAQFTGGLTGSITENGATSSAGILQATGSLDASFNYTPTNPIHDDNATEFLAATTSKTNGIFSVDSAGTWTYKSLANNPNLQKLAAGATLTESFVVKTADGKASTTVTLTLNGSNTVSEGAAGTVTESNTATTTTISGVLSVLDTGIALESSARPSDLTTANTAASTSGGSSGSYGLFTYTASTNKWTYALTNALVTQLAANETVIDSLVLGTGEIVDVVIKGVNDVATVSAIVPVTGATALGSDTTTAAILVTLTEDNSSDITGGNLKATGKLTATDVDTGEAAFIAQTVSDSVGVFTLESDGDWTYIASNTNATIQKLTSATTSLLTRNYTAKTVDGVTKAIGIKILGASNNTFAYDAVTLDADITNTVSGQLKNLDGTISVTPGAYSHAVTTHGKLVIGADGKFVYHLADTNFTTGDTETVTVTVGSTTTDVIITLTKSDLPNVVTGNTSGSLTLEADGSTALVTGDLNAVDPDDASSENFDTNAYASPSYGTVTILANGNWSYQVDDANSTLKALTSAQSLTDTFIVQTDGSGTEGSTTVSIVITGKKDAPVGVNDANSCEEDASITSSVSVVANDTDVDSGQQATLSVAFAKKSGGVASAVSSAGTAITGLYGTLTIKSNGTYTYKADLPASDLLATAATGNDVFVYTVKDADGETHTANLTITVTGKEDGSAVEATSGDDTITATANDETIDGLAGDDVINGGDGADTLSGSAGNDEIDGQDGNDIIKGGDGADTLTGGNGNDSVDGEAGADTISDAAGTNTLKGGAGNDIITGGTGADTIEGGADNDYIAGGAGADSLKGEAGDDLLVYGSGDTLVDGGSGTDTLRILGSTTVDMTTVFANIERVEGKSSDVDPEAATNNAQTLLVNSTVLTSVVYIDLGAGTDELQVSGTVTLASTTLVGVDTIQGLGSDDTVTGTANADTIKGGAGDDTIDGGAGIDTLLGEAGDDTFIWSASNDTITGGETSEDGGGDVLKASGTVDISGATITEVEKLLGVATLTDVITIKGSEGFTAIDLGTATGTASDTVIFNVNALDLTGVTLTGVEAIKSVVTANAADTLTLAGSTTLDTLKSIDLGSNTDTLKISGSVDLSAITLTGVETLNGDGAVANEVVTLTVSSTNSSLGSLTTLNLGGGTADELKVQGTLSLSGATVSNIEKLTGSTAADTITIKGTEGFTTIDLDDGADTLVVTAATVTFAGVTLTDVELIKGNGTVQTITGSAGNDTFEVTTNVTIDGGTAGTDVVKGTSGDDFIYLDKITNVDTIDALDATGDDDVLIVGSSSSLTGVTISNFEKIEGTSGNDNFTIDATAFGVITGGGITSIDLKAGTNTVIVSGTTAVDFSSFTFSNVSAIQGNTAANTITGTSGADVIKGGDGDDILFWDADDTFDGENNNDTVKGSADADTIALANISNVETIDGLGNGSDVLVVSGAATLAAITLANIESIEGLSGADSLTIGTVAALGAVASIDLKAGANKLLVTGTVDLSAITLAATGGTLTVEGTAGVETITVGNAGHTIDGKGGADVLTGGTGNDSFYWYASTTINGTSGTDSVLGTTGNDTIVLASLSNIDTINGLGSGDTDKVTVSGTATLAGITLSNVESVEGSASADTLTLNTIAALGGASIDLLAGANTVIVTADAVFTSVTVSATGGTVSLQASAAGVDITGTAGDDTFVGSSGANILIGGAGNDTFTWDSADTFDGGANADTLNGTAADDTFALEKISNIETIVSGGGTDTISFAGAASLSGITLTGFGTTLNLSGSGSDDTLTLNTAAFGGFTTVNIAGGAHSTGDVIDLVGNLNLSNYNISQFEKITGTDNGTHVITLGVSGANSTFGNFTHVTLGSDNADELVVQGTLDMSGKTISGVEKLTGSSSDDALTIKGSEGFTTIALGAGVNTLIIADDAASLATAATFTGVTLVQFENDVDTFTGSNTSTTYEWNANLVTLTAGSGGADTVVGTTGDDTIDLSKLVNVETVDGKEGTGDAIVIDGTISATLSNFEVMTGGANADTVTLTAAQLLAFTSIDLNNGTDKIIASGAGTFNLSNVVDVEQIEGTAAQQTILIGTSVGYTIDGKGGSDTITGGAGNDTITYYVGDIVDGGNGSDTLLVSGTATVTLTGTSNIETVQGNAEDNIITGGATADTLKGGAGADTLSGAGGNDSLFGEAGNDIFVYSTGDDYDGGSDTDTLQITAGGFTTLASSTLNDVENISVANTAAVAVETLVIVDANLDDVTLVHLGAGADTLQIIGNVDLSGLTLSGAETILGTSADNVLTIKDANLNDVTSIDLGTDSTDDILRISGSVDLATTTLTGVEIVNGDGTTSNEVLTLRVNTDSVLDSITTIDLGNGTTDELVVSGTVDLSSATINNVEILRGSGSADVITVDDSSDNFTTIDLGGGTDELIFSGSLDLSVKTLIDTETLTGDGNANVLTLSVVAGNSTLGSITDVDLLGGTDELVVQGVVSLTAADFVLVEELSGGATDDVVTVKIADITATNFTAIDLDTGTDILVVDGANGAVDLSTGSRTIAGAELIRFVNVTASAITGTAGGQTYEWNAAITSLTGGAGADVLKGTAGVDTIDFAKLSGIETINGLGGVDILSIAGATSLAGITLTNVETIDSSAAAVLTLASVPTGVSTIDLTTGSSDLTLSAAASYDFSNIDLVGVDDLTAAAGSTVTVKNLSSADVTEFIGGGAYALILSGTSNLTGVTISATIPTITGSTGADIITLNDDGLTIDAGNGVDTVTGGTGADVITGGDGADNLSGGAGTDTLDGGGDDNDADSLFGGADADTLNFYTSDLVDSFDGGADTDTLVFKEDAGTSGTDFDLSSINMSAIEILDTRGGGLDVFLAIDGDGLGSSLTVNCNAGDEITVTDEGVTTTYDSVAGDQAISIFGGFTITIDFA